jgi:hypothetical protein
MFRKLRKYTLRKKGGQNPNQQISRYECNREILNNIWNQLGPIFMSINPNIQRKFSLFYDSHPIEMDTIRNRIEQYLNNQLTTTTTPRDFYNFIKSLYSEVTNNRLIWPDIMFDSNGQIQLGITNPSVVGSILRNPSPTSGGSRGGQSETQISRIECNRGKIRQIAQRIMTAILSSTPTIEAELNNYYQSHPQEKMQIENTVEQYLNGEHVNTNTTERNVYNTFKAIYSQITQNRIVLPDIKFDDFGKLDLGITNPSLIGSIGSILIGAQEEEISGQQYTLLMLIMYWKALYIVITNNLYSETNVNKLFDFFAHSLNNENRGLLMKLDQYIRILIVNNNNINNIVTDFLNIFRHYSTEDILPLGNLRSGNPNMSTTPDFLTGAIMNPEEMYLFSDSVIRVLNTYPPPPTLRGTQDIINEFMNYFQTNQDKFTQFVQYVNNLIKTATPTTNPNTFFNSIINWLLTNTTITSVSIFTNPSPAASGGKRNKSRKYKNKSRKYRH